MVRKASFIAVLGAVFLAGTAAYADEYRPDEFLKLDLSKAVLSPKPLGPPAQFEPMPVQAKTDAQSTAVDASPAPADVTPQHANATPKRANAAPRHVNAAPKAARGKVARAPAEKPRVPAAARLARKHTNPLDAQASDTRIQVWPCRSGGICNWQR